MLICDVFSGAIFCSAEEGGGKQQLLNLDIMAWVAGEVLLRITN
jgi:hypothetical protein